jgi:hypothetical protein
MLDTYLWDTITSTGKRQGTIYVTPDLAQRILNQRGTQRKLTLTRIENYIRDMKAGKWADDAGGALLFDTEGLSRGGQHRLTAQVAANVDVSYVIRWDQTEAEIAADNEGGQPWRSVDIAGGELPHRSLRQSIGTTLLQVDFLSGNIGSQPHWNPGRLEIAAVVNDHRVVRAAEVGSAISSAVKSINGTGIGVMYAVLNNAANDIAPYWFESIRLGASLTEGDPALTLRNMLIGATFKNLTQKKWQTMHVTTRAWNYHVNGETVAKLQRFSPGYSKPVRPVGWKPFFRDA